MNIRSWIEATFAKPEQRTFVEIGCHRGQDTRWLAAIPGVTVHAIEPDPRNTPPELPNVVFHRLAIAGECGPLAFRLSSGLNGRAYTKSSSIHQPKNHLTVRPDVTFGGEITVDALTLDAFTEKHGIKQVALIWADVQGAERELIEDGQATLARTSYLYTEYSDDELYEGQPTLAEILAMLPGWQVIHQWPYDVLLSNHGGA